MKSRTSNITAGGRAGSEQRRRGGGTIGFADSVLVERTRTGDMQAFGLLVAKYQDRVFNMVCRMVGRREDAEELAQEAFLKALEKISQFRGQSKFYTWLFRIAVNLAISHRRRGGRIKFQSLDAENNFSATQAGALAEAKGTASPECTVMAAEARSRVVEALEQLDDESRIVVLLRDIEDMEYSQISEVLAVPMGTVKSRLHRARLELREKLADVLE